MKIKFGIIYVIILIVYSQCAQITPLTGGKKDNVPPKAIVYEPKNATVNFDKKVIQIYFDEYITLKDITTQFLITPQTNELPDIQSNGKKLKITFKENLLPNTTYKLFFGNAIVDIKEANAIANFEYVFSTGNTIDSLNFKGLVIDAKNNKSVANSLVGLYNINDNDSIVYKKKPLYISKTNAEGLFKFNYLPKSTFKIIAINDVNKNLMYDGSTEDIAFSNDNINTDDSTKLILKQFKEIASKQYIKKIMNPEYGKVILAYNRPMQSLKTVTVNNEKNSFFINQLKDSITIYYNNVFDSLKLIVNHDVSYKDTVNIKIQSKSEYDKLIKGNRLKYIIKTNFIETLPHYESIRLELNMPFDLKILRKEKISIFEIKDSIKTKIEFIVSENIEKSNSYYVKANLKENNKYELMIDKGAFSNDIGRINDSINYKFNTNSKEDYGTLNLKLIFPKKENYIVELLNEAGEIIKTTIIQLSLTSSSNQLIEFKNLKPANYFVKVTEDANKNNAYNTGNYLLKIQSEIIYYNVLPIKILADWEVENEWIIK